MRRDGRHQSDAKQSASSAIQLLAAKREARLQAQAALAVAGTTGSAASAVTAPTAAAHEPRGNGPLLAEAAHAQLPGDDPSSEDDFDFSRPAIPPAYGSGHSGGRSTSHPLSRLVRRGTGASNSNSSNGRGPAADLDSLLNQMASVAIVADSDAGSPGMMQPNHMKGRHIGQATGSPGSAAAAAGLGTDSDGSSSSSSSNGDASDNDAAAPTAYTVGQQAAVPRMPSATDGATGSSTVASDSNALVLEGGFELPGRIAQTLYAHQLEGVRWLWSLQRVGKGGILGDDMGLGKTMQVSAFLAGLLKRSKLGRRALVVAPKTLLAHWQKELGVCGLGGRVHCFFGSSEGERTAALRAVCSAKGGGGVLLTTYGMVLHNAALLTRPNGGATGRWDADIDDDDDGGSTSGGPRLCWDWLILDEGHKVKNPRMQLAQRLRELHARARLIISGTPIQNNMMELHALLDFVAGGLLGDAKAFKARYERTISLGQDRQSNGRAREAGAAAAAELRRVIAPYFLRREKREVFGVGGEGPAAEAASTGAGGAGTNNSTGSGGTGACDGAASGSSSSAGGAAGASVSVPAASADGNTASSSSSSRAGGGAVPGRMGRKNDVVVWLRLSPLQRHVYEAFLHSDAVKAALNSSRSPLAALTVLKKVCDHPALLSERAAKLVVSAGAKFASKGAAPGGSNGGDIRRHFKGSKRRNSLDDFIVNDEDDTEEEEEDTQPGPRQQSHSDDASASDGGSDDGDDDGCDSSGSGGSGDMAAQRRAAAAAAIAYTEDWCNWASGTAVESRLLSDLEQRGADASCKSAFVAALLRELAGKGHRMLVFSQSRVMLDILQAAVSSLKLRYCRIDGSMASAEARQAEVARFQAPGANIPVFLLTSQVGGLGLTLTAADRVIIVDPSWNPATDNQSVDRAYRIGQVRDVVVYRLITCGTVEEKIYRKQVFKGGLSRTGTEEGVQLRYFTHQELHQLFAISEEGLITSETQQMLNQLHGAQRSTSAALAQHLAWVEGWAGCAGTSDHDLLFSEKEAHDASVGFTEGGMAWAAETAAPSGRDVQRRGGQGRQGADDLSNMLNTMSLSSQQQRTPQQRAIDEQHALIERLEGKVRQCSVSLEQLGGRLLDGGAKLRRQLQDLNAELAAARQQLQLLMGTTTAADGTTPSVPTSSSHVNMAGTTSSNTSSTKGGSSGMPNSATASWPNHQQDSQQGGQRRTGPSTSTNSTASGATMPPQQHRAPPTLIDITNSTASGWASAAGQPAGCLLPPPQHHRQPPPPPPPQQQQQQQQVHGPPRHTSHTEQQQQQQQTLGNSSPPQEPDEQQLRLRKHVLKKELYRLEEAVQVARRAGNAAELGRLKRLQRPLYDEYREVKALLEEGEGEEAAPGGAPRAAAQQREARAAGVRAAGAAGPAGRGGSGDSRRSGSGQAVREDGRRHAQEVVDLT